ncbi:hypothetical protein tb265_26430 [Gemmatimonadetes bacterium T265]|nr:hypothetical protein tb265_26430 [Gemmatimonadetes bacterium T265]
MPWSRPRSARPVRLARLIVACALGGACARDRPGATAAASAGGASANAPAPPPAPLSRFTVPLDYDVTPVLAIVERAVPRTFGSLDQVHQVGNDARKHFAYAATRAPFVVTIDGPEVHLRTTLAYAARGYYRTPLGATLHAGCGADDDPARRPHVVVELVAPLTLAPNWHLHSESRLAGLAPASTGPADRCRVGIINMDVTDRVIDAARRALATQMPAIDRKVAGVDLTPQATGWWRALNRPIRLTDGVWLLLGPQTLREGRVGGSGHLLAVEAGLDAFPKIVTGAEPQVQTPPLPALARGVGTPGFRVRLQGVVDYATASRAVTAAVRGRSVTRAGQTITVGAVTAAPAAGGRLTLTVAFAGDASGTLRFVGTPRLDRSAGQLVVPDLDYDLATDSRLVNAAAWIGSDALRRLFRERARVPLAPALDRGRALLLSGLNRTVADVLTLSATVDSVAVESVHVTAPGLVVQASASGQARVSVRQRGGVSSGRRVG